MKASATEQQTSRSHAADHRTKRIKETADHFLGGRTCASTDVNARQAAARMLENEALTAAFVTFEGFHREAVEGPKGVWCEVVKVLTQRGARHFSKVLGSIALHVREHHTPRVHQTVQHAGFNLLGAHDEAGSRRDHGFGMRIEQGVFCGHEGLELVHVVDFDFGFSHALLQSERARQDRHLNLLQVPNLTVKRNALIQNNPRNEAAVAEVASSTLGHPDAFVGQRVTRCGPLHEQRGVHHQRCEFGPACFGTGAGHRGQGHV